MRVRSTVCVFSSVSKNTTVGVLNSLHSEKPSRVPLHGWGTRTCSRSPNSHFSFDCFRIGVCLVDTFRLARNEGVISVLSCI